MNQKPNMYFNLSPDAALVAQRQFLQKTTFKDKFEVVWKFVAPCLEGTYLTVDKTIADSMHWRTIGNSVYTNVKNLDYLSQSICAYTKSIAFAPVGSSELSLAYANRSAVLFKARLYEDCLLDIERALKSSYPDKLKTKLFIRQLLCFKALNQNSRLEQCISHANAVQWLPDLIKSNPNYNLKDEHLKMMNGLEKPRDTITFVPEIRKKNSLIVGGSNAIKLKKTNDNKQHIVAKRDIKSGEFIYLSEPLALALRDELRFSNCWHCGRQTWAGVPCDQCPSVVFCSEQCKEKAWNEYHDIECLVLRQFSKPLLLIPNYSLTVKIISKAINSAGGLIELKKKIDNIKDNDEMIFTNGVNTIDNFNRLDYFKATSNVCTFEITIIAIGIAHFFCEKTNILGKKTSLKDLTKDKNKYEKMLILGELILRYSMTVVLNAQIFTEEDETLLWLHNIPFCKIIKKSCDPNVDWVCSGSNVGYYASKPIKQGEPILMSVIGPYYYVPKTNRYMVIGLTTNDPVPCACTACVENWPTMEFLPSFMNMELPMRIKVEMSQMMLQLRTCQSILCHGDTQQLLKIKDRLNSMNNKVHQRITRPCREKSEINLALRQLYCQLLKINRSLK